MKTVLVPALAVLLGAVMPARADAPARPAVDWDSLISFASSLQDRRVYHVEDADEVAGLVAKLRDGLVPALRLYSAAVQEGPPPIQLRAAYYIGLAQVNLMTRARTSLSSSDLRTTLEPLLEPHAELAYFVFTTIHRAADEDPSLTPDVVTRHMARSSRELAAALRHRWPTPPGDDEPRIARPR